MSEKEIKKIIRRYHELVEALDNLEMDLEMLSSEANDELNSLSFLSTHKKEVDKAMAVLSAIEEADSIDALQNCRNHIDLVISGFLKGPTN